MGIFHCYVSLPEGTNISLASVLGFGKLTGQMALSLKRPVTDVNFLVDPAVDGSELRLVVYPIIWRVFTGFAHPRWCIISSINSISCFGKIGCRLN